MAKRSVLYVLFSLSSAYLFCEVLVMIIDVYLNTLYQFPIVQFALGTALILFCILLPSNALLTDSLYIHSIKYAQRCLPTPEAPYLEVLVSENGRLQT